MREYSVNFREKLRKMDYIVLLCAVAMTALGIITLWAAQDKVGMRRVMVQSIAAGIGILLYFVISFFDYDRFIKKMTIPLFFLSIFLLTVVLVFGQGEGNKSWLKIPGLPVDIQPSEFVKLFFIITFSRHVDRVRDNINHIKNVAALALHGGLITGMVALTGDLGSALVFMVVMAAILFVGGLSLWYFLGAAVLVVAVFPLLWEHLGEYQRMRILVGFNPDMDPKRYGYQAILSRRAIAAGSFWGRGFHGGTVYKTLPIAESDFLFAVMNEKFGFIASFLYMVLMCVMIVRTLFIARTARKNYASLICVGIIAVLIAQTVENIGMCLAMLPVVGITLPFLSYGGSSMLTSYLMIALIGSIKSHNQKYFFERELR